MPCSETAVAVRPWPGSNEPSRPHAIDISVEVELDVSCVWVVSHLKPAVLEPPTPKSSAETVTETLAPYMVEEDWVKLVDVVRAVDPWKSQCWVPGRLVG